MMYTLLSVLSKIAPNCTIHFSRTPESRAMLWLQYHYFCAISEDLWNFLRAKSY